MISRSASMQNQLTIFCIYQGEDNSQTGASLKTQTTFKSAQSSSPIISGLHEKSMVTVKGPNLHIEDDETYGIKDIGFGAVVSRQQKVGSGYSGHHRYSSHELVCPRVHHLLVNGGSPSLRSTISSVGREGGRRFANAQPLSSSRF